MNVEGNPFHILRASTRDSRQRLIELADEQTLMQDPQLVAEARATLTNPRRRLGAEVAWMPGVSQSRCQAVMDLLYTNSGRVLNLDLYPPLAGANIGASALAKPAEHLGNGGIENLRENIEFDDAVNAICDLFEKVDAEEIFVLLNEDRIVAGFNEITALADVQQALERRREELKHLLKAAFNKLESGNLVCSLTAIVEDRTDFGKRPAPKLLDDLIDSYELEARPYFHKQEEVVHAGSENIRKAAEYSGDDYALKQLVDDFAQWVKNWDEVAQPIQVSYRSRGMPHEASERMAHLVRNLALCLYNEHGLLEFAKQLTDLQHEVFAELDHVVEQITEDSATLGDIALQHTEMRNRAKDEEQSWCDEMSYRAASGTIIKKSIEISAKAITWNKQSTLLSSISAVSWGGTRHSINGIPTGTTYKIVYKSGSGSIPTRIETRNKDIYNNILDRLWKGVCVRILTEMLDGLRNGKSYRFGHAVVWDTGVELGRSSLFSANAKMICRWPDLVVSNGGGFFIIRKNGDKKFKVALDYQNDDNIHILEAAIRAYFKKPSGARISDLLT